MRRSCAIGLLAAVVGCRSLIPDAGRGAPAANVVRASQYAITTDYPISSDDSLVTDLLGLRDAVFSTLELPPARTMVRIVIFDSRDKYADFLKRNFPDLPMRRAFFVQHGTDQLVVYAWRGDNLRDDLRHEATHALLHSAMPEVPIWLDEGLAEYFEVATQAAAAGRPRHVASLEAAVRSGWKPDLPRLEKLKDIRQLSAADYRESWLWVHYCLHRTPTTRRALLAHIATLRQHKSDSLAARLGTVEHKPYVSVLEHLAGLADAPPSAEADSQFPAPRGGPLEAVRRLGIMR